MVRKMRHQLEQFEGQNVVVQGRMTRRVQQPDGTYDVCFAAIKVRPLRSDIPMEDVAPIKVDHAWMRGLTPDQLEPGTLSESYTCAAKVSYYTRTNGSYDLGFVVVHSIAIEYVMEKAMSLADPSSSAGYMRNRLQSIEDGVLVWGMFLSAEEGIKQLRYALSRIDGSITRTFGTHLTATANGPCRRLDLLPKVKHGRTVAQGFA